MYVPLFNDSNRVPIPAGVPSSKCLPLAFLLSLLAAGGLGSPAVIEAEEVPYCEVDRGDERVQGECTEDFWKYSLRDPRAFTVGYIKRQCKHWLEGTWVSGGWGANECVDTVAVPFPDEASFITKGERYVNSLDSDCSVTHHTDRGWLAPGESFDIDAWEVAKPRYVDGIEVYNAKELIFHTSCKDGDTGGRRLVAERGRRYIGMVDESEYYLEEPPNCDRNTASRGNPVDVATGEKRQSETDYSGNGLRFTRRYRSWGNAGGGRGLGRGWRHNFSARLQEGPLLPDGGGGARSGLHGSAEAACLDGWGEIEGEAFRGLLAGQSVRYQGGVCEVLEDGVVAATLPVHSTDEAVDAPADPATVTLVRPGGDALTFIEHSGAWQPTRNLPLSLTEAAGGWSLRDENGVVERYDTAGRLLSRTTRTGRTTAFAYNDAGRVAEITGPFGRTLTFSYDADGRLIRLETPDGPVTYGYDTAGNLGSVTYPDGATRSYLYEDSAHPHHLTGILDESGERYAGWSYDAEGRVTESRHAGGAETVTFTYGADGSTTVTDANGAAQTYRHGLVNGALAVTGIEGGRCADCTGAPERRYDADGNLVETRDWNGTTTTYAYNDRGLEVRRTEAAGTAAERSVTTEWHPDRRLPVRITEPGRVTELAYDAQGRRVRRTLRDPATGAERTWRYGYDSRGLLVEVDGPRTDVQDVTRREYDAQGNLIRTVNALGQATGITAHDPAGRPLRTVDPNGLVTDLAYDARGRLVERTVGGETTRFSYDAVGNLTAASLPDGRRLQYRYDAARRLVAIEDQAGNRIEYTLDAAGNRVEERVYGPTGALARSHRQVFDDLGRLVESVGAQGQTTRYGYDAAGNRTRAADPAGDTTAYAFDALDRLVRAIDALGGETGYDYDGQGRLSAVTDPNGNTTRYRNDGLGNRTRRESPDTGTTTYEYDAAGNMTARTDARGVTNRYGYDALNRLVRIEYADGKVTAYEYDTCTNGIGRLCGISEPSGTTRWSYDAHGRRTERLQVADGVTLTTRYGYGPGGRAETMVYPSGAEVTYRYTAGQLTGIEVDGEPLLTGIEHEPFGPVSGWTWGSGATHGMEYDHDGRLVEHTMPGGRRTLDYAPDGNIVGITGPNLDRTYGYDALDRLTAATGPELDQVYTYDPNGNRLEKSDAGAVESYSYEAGNNRLLEVTGSRSATYGYDAMGNTVDDGDHTFEYDARGRMVTVDGGATATYRYNALGQRVFKHAELPIGDIDGSGGLDKRDPQALHAYLQCQRNPKTGLCRKAPESVPLREGDCDGDGALTRDDVKCLRKALRDPQPPTYPVKRRFVYDRDGHLIGVYGEGGEVVQEIVYLNNRPVGILEEGALYTIHTDHLGTPRVVADSAGIAVWRWKADPFGVGAPEEDLNTNGNSFALALRFPGQYFDAETGLHYNYFRDYAPELGRYVESDPIDLYGGLNTYAYAGSNPLRHSDPKGLFWGNNPPSGPVPNPNPTPSNPSFPGSSCGPAGSPNNFPNGMFGQWGFEFACQWHDDCYGACGADKGYCDKKFKEIMLWECNKIGDVVARQTCRNMAYSYYQAVNHFGDEPYNNAQKGCSCSP